MQHRLSPRRHRRALRRVPLVAALALGAGSAAAACGSNGPGSAGASGGSSSSGASASAANSGSCTGVAGAHHARVVVEVSPKKVVQRCVGFAGSTIAALTLLKDSRIEVGTQKFSFGVAICQVDHVPSHYTQCLPSGQDYWGLFFSARGHGWTSPSTGVSGISVPAGGSLGLRYDAPTGTPLPPPRPSPA